jgi:MFS family permease
MDAVQPDRPATATDIKSNAPSPPLPSLLELTTKSSASILIIIYGLGFVILGFHDAKYGVVQFSPFRARIVLVGFVFAMLVALAAAAYHYRYAYIAPLESVVKDLAPERHRERDTVLAAGFIFTAFLMASLIGMFILNLPQANSVAIRWRLLYLGTYLAALGIYHLVNKIFSRKPRLALILSLIASFGFLLALPNSGGSYYQAIGGLATIFMLVGWHTYSIKATGPLKYASDFRNWLFVLLFLWTYISSVFNNIPPRWGGGQPTPVVIFQNTQAPWSPSNPMDAFLLDETDQGFYVLLTPTGKAFFMPRGNVETVFFGTKEELTKK